MILSHCNFFSKTLLNHVDVDVLLPSVPDNDCIGMALEEIYTPVKPYPVLYLLHGALDDHSMWLRHTDIEALAEKAGVAGALSMESTEWLDVLMNLHDDIKPKTMSRFADDAEYEDAKVELAGRIIGDIMQLPQLTDAEAIFEGIQRHNMEVAKAAAGDESRAAEVEKGLKGVQKAQSKEFNRRLAENQRTAGRNAEVQQMRQI